MIVLNHVSGACSEVLVGIALYAAEAEIVP
jgi:hypothetical protein